MKICAMSWFLLEHFSPCYILLKDAARRKRGGEEMKFLVGLVIGLLIFPFGIWIYLTAGSPPVATSDKAFPFEEAIVHVPLHSRIARELIKAPPVEASPTNLQIGAHIYRQQCAACHGLYGLPASFAKGMYPQAPQLWEPHRDGVVGVSDDPPGETYWKVANGIRLSGMPAFSHILNQTQMWQVSQLLANADKPLPPDVLTLLKQPLDLDPGATQ
jgi:thiosulfate dehydrogenase